MAERITQIRKRDGRVMPFEKPKIADAIFKAAQAVGGEDRFLAEELASAVTDYLNRHFEAEVPGIEDIQDMVEKVLIETGHAKTAKAYILYRDRRAQTRREMTVRKVAQEKTAARPTLRCWSTRGPRTPSCRGTRVASPTPWRKRRTLTRRPPARSPRRSKTRSWPPA